MSKRYIYWLGLITLLIFPIPAYFVLYYYEGITVIDFLHFDQFQLIPVAYGIYFGICYAVLAILLLQSPIFETIPLPVTKVMRELNLNWKDAVFLSLCAAIGEELLFRVGVQHYLHVVTTSVIFVAIHGYFGLKPLKKSLYGLIVLPFILAIGYGYETFGLWFSISAHFAYDLVLFAQFLNQTENTIEE